MNAHFSEVNSLLSAAVGKVAPTLVCRVEQGGTLLFEGSYGWLNPASQTRPTPADAVFDLASLTKLFTTTAFLRLVADDQVAIDQTVAEIVPEFGGQRIIGGTEDPLSKRPLPAVPEWSGAIVDANTVTFRHLLTHTSGLPAWRSLYRMCGAPPVFPLDDAEIARRQQCALDAIVGFPFVAPPGLSYAYSDIGLILLGMAVERLHGQRLDAAIHALVSEPLGMGVCYNPPAEIHSTVAATEDDPWRGRRLRGEVHDENAAGLGGIAGHAGLFGSAADLCRLGRLYLRGGAPLLSPILAHESIRAQQIPTVDERRGLGWMLHCDPNPSCGPLFSPESFGHTGFTGTSLWCDPARDLCVALLTNRVYAGRDRAAIAALRPALHSAIIQAVAS